jgi:hypothetical protein
MFSEAINLFWQYRTDLLHQKGEISDAEAEIGHKLEQLQWLLAREDNWGQTTFPRPWGIVGQSRF